MRLALLAPAPPYRGGIVTHSATLWQTLLDRGHSVFWSSYRRQYPWWLFPGSDQVGEVAPWLFHENQPRLVPWSPVSWWRTARDLQAERPSAVIFPYWMPFFAPALWGVLRQVRRQMRVISILHNVVPHEKQPFARSLTGLALSQCHGFIAQSENARDQLFGILPTIDQESVRVTPHPLYDFGKPGSKRRTRAEARTALGLPKESRVVLFFGFIKPYKGVGTLIEAAPLLRERYGPEGVNILIVGDVYGDRETLRERVRLSGAEEVITLIDQFVPDSEVEDLFMAADLVVLPYLSATQSGILQIAWNYNRPVVTTDVGGLPEVVRDGETGFIVPPGDASALGGAMIRFFDENRAESFSSAVALERTKYSWEGLAEAVEFLAESTENERLVD